MKTISIGGWRILEYGGTRGCDRSRPISTAEEDEGSRAAALDKRFQSAEARADEAEREAEKLR